MTIPAVQNPERPTPDARQTARAAGVLDAHMLLLIGSAFARTPDPISTDRPDVAESSAAMDTGVYQLEQGIELSGQGSATAFSFPSLSRYGIGGNVEARIETPFVYVSGGSVAFAGVSAGVKWHLPFEWPSLALLASADFDGQGNFTPVGKIAWDVDLPTGIGLGINVGMTTAPGLRSPSALWALSVGRPVNRHLRLYVEGSGQTAPGWFFDQVALDAGATVGLSDNVQWDVYGLYGVVGGGWSAGTGLSVRFD